MLTARHLTVRYGGVVAVDDISFTVGQGEVVALIGANGAGKSSTLMALCGLADVGGEIILNGEH
ncbi:MAG: ATP-binding cassette domain-containing protein, partial [Calditrichaeota bacterium]|nr:ATP-binding cassette domain-containing protein [Calditrichota bacterium]